MTSAGGAADIAAVENELRAVLTGVDLVCEADPSAALLDEAEQICRPAFLRCDYNELADRAPATLVAYVAVRGAERCDGIRVWPQLGVEQRSQEAGRAFLRALRRLGLPDFQDMVERENARRYVAPILIHGGIPADRARTLVERLERELERGLTDGREAVERLCADPEGLGKPVTRLLTYATEFAADLLDTLITRITGETTGTQRSLPRHIREALETDVVRRGRSYRRVRTPYVEYDPWTGLGPEVRCPDGAGEWVLDVAGGPTVVLRSGESVDTEPCGRLVAQSEGRRIVLWNQPVLWFDENGLLLPPDAELPRIATAVLPVGWRLHADDGRPVDVVDEGEALSGSWSDHRTVTIDLTGAATVTAVPPAGSPDRPCVRRVSHRGEPRLVTAPAEGVTTVDGAAVFAIAPRVEVPRADGPIPVWFTPAAGRPCRWLHDPAEEGLHVDLTERLGPGAHVGRVEVRDTSGRHHGFDLAVVPGLTVEGLAGPLPPRASTTARLRAAPGILPGGALAVDVPPHVGHVDVDVPGTAVRLRVHVPRVRWALRSGRPERLTLASDVIETDPDALLTDDVRLLVRCGREAAVELRLHVDGRPLQVGRRARTGGPHQQCSLPLAPFADTLRHHRDAALELVLVVDDVPMVAVVCGRPTPRTDNARHWAPPPRRTGHTGDDVWSSVEWLRTPVRRSALEEIGDRLVTSLADPLLVRLRALAPVEQVVAFVDELGDRTRRWAAEITAGAGPARSNARRWGPGGAEWAAFEAIGDEIWRLQGRRYRQFANKRPEDGLREWSNDTKHALRRSSKTLTTDLELWTFGRLPPVDRLTDQKVTDWLHACQPRRRSVRGLDVFPAALAYQVLALAGGQADAGNAVAEAARLAPAPLLDLVAWLLEIARRGHVFRPLALAEEDDVEGAIHDDPGEEDAVAPSAGPAPDVVVQREPHPPPLRTLAGCDIEVDGRDLYLCPRSPATPPLLRVWSTGSRPRAQAALTPSDAGERWRVRIPEGVEGDVLLTVGDQRSLGFDPAAGVAVHLPAAERTPPPCCVRGRDLEELDRLLRAAQVEAIATAAERGDPAQPAVEALFEDEQDATRALVEYARSCQDPARLDRLGIAVLPAAMIFSTLPVTDRDETHLRASSLLLWAALAPRDAARWRYVHWPHPAAFGRGHGAYDDVVEFAERRLRDCTDGLGALTTVRYAISDRKVAGAQVRATVRRLDQRTDPVFVDLAVAAYCALAVEAVTPEATRLLLDAHRHRPISTTSAVLVGTALALAEREP